MTCTSNDMGEVDGNSNSLRLGVWKMKYLSNWENRLSGE